MINRVTKMLFASLWPLCAQAQDIHFSQFYENALLRNPALTGIFTGDYKAGVNYRNQWNTFATPFVTTIASAETKFIANKETADYVSLGLTGVYDQAGAIDFNSLAIYAAVNYNKSLEDERHSYLSAGFAGGYIQRSIDVGKMTFANQYVNGVYTPDNPSEEAVGINKIQHFDVSAGLSFNSSLDEAGRTNYYLGVAAFHLTQPKETFYNGESFTRLSTRWTGNAGFSTPLSDKTGLIVHANYQYQDPYQEIIFGGLVSYTQYFTNRNMKVNLYGGMLYRWKDAFIPTMKFEYKKWALTCTYDISVNHKRIYMNANGGFEISLYMKGRFYHNDEEMKCPRFEMLKSEDQVFR